MTPTSSLQMSLLESESNSGDKLFGNADIRTSVTLIKQQNQGVKNLKGKENRAVCKPNRTVCRVKEGLMFPAGKVGDW